MNLDSYIKKKEKEALENKLDPTGVKYILIELYYKDYYHLLNSLNETIDEMEYDKVINKYVKEKKSCQYILGYQYFYGRKFCVNPNVLIPRSETELLVEKAIELVNTYNICNILDIGTGSGIIPITLSKEVKKKINIDAVDISKDALDVAITNYTNLCDTNNSKINFIESDLFSNCNNKYDLIISNPPYIPETYEVDEYVRCNEPNIALYGGVDGLDIYKRIINDLGKFLNNNGYVLFEIGYDQGESIKKLILERYSNANVIIYKDYNQLDRIVFIQIGE